MGTGMRIQKQSLGQLIPIAKGGFGEVFKVAGYHLPGDSADLAYKEFTSHEAEQAKNAKVAVAFQAGLSPAEQADLDANAAWPLALVEDPAGVVKGLLMHLVPPDFFCRAADANTGALKDKPREMGWLVTSAKQRAVAHVNLRDVNKLERHILLGKLIYAIGRLHKHGWVFGDLSFRNAVFALDPPRVLLLDCDGAAPLSDRTRKQANTLCWDPPEFSPGAQNLQNAQTDVYKLGLAILRCMVPGKGAMTDKSASRVAGVLDAEGQDLVTRAVGPDPGRRPSARELYQYFYRAVSARIPVPDVAAVQLRNRYRVRGQDVHIDWQISQADTVTVVAGAQRLQVDLKQQPNGCVFRPDDSGPVSIEVVNRYGSVWFDLGEVTLYELPPFKVDFTFLPTPRVPPLPTLSMAALDRIVAGAPTLRLPEAPVVPSLDTFNLVESLTRSATLTVQLPPFGAAVADASAAITAALQAQADQIGASVRTAYLANQGHTGN